VAIKRFMGIPTADILASMQILLGWDSACMANTHRTRMQAVSAAMKVKVIRIDKLIVIQEPGKECVMKQ
jgi:hypothetical protein